MTEERQDYQNEPEEQVTDPEQTEQTTENTEQQTKPESTLSQEQMQKALDRRLARERSQWEKRMKKIFGTTNLEQAGEYYRAGHMVSQASGTPPSAIVQRIQQKTGGNSMAPVGQAQNRPVHSGGDPDLRREISEIKGIISEQHEQKVRSEQESAAKKEFGQLYDDYSMDIEEYAEDRGLSLVDAAAVVLRPKLKEYYETRAVQKKQTQRKRRVDPTSDSPASGEDPSSKLNGEQKRVARKMGLSYKDYYTQMRELGQI